MKTLALLIITIVLLAGCINQANQTLDTNLSENTTPPSTIPPTTPPSTTPENVTPPENVTQPENVSIISPPKTFDVAIRNFVFSLTITTIKVGDSVKWTNFDVVTHTATADDGSFDTGLLNKGESKTIAFNTSGTYSYHCIPHSWMIGKIVVK
jgi:plastocyanin